MKLASVKMPPFVFVERRQQAPGLPEPEYFSADQILRIDRRTHAGIPADAIEPSAHGRGTGHQSFPPQTPRVAVAKSAFQGPVDEQIWLA